MFAKPDGKLAETGVEMIAPRRSNRKNLENDSGSAVARPASATDSATIGAKAPMLFCMTTSLKVDERLAIAG
jgi:hypothetical protein